MASGSGTAPANAREFKTFEELANMVDKNGGVVTVTMGQLRDAYGAGKLGVHIRNGISDRLRQRGLRHWPEELPIYQEQYARIYRDGSLVGKVISAAVRDLGEAADQILRDAAGGEDSANIQRIREIVCA